MTTKNQKKNTKTIQKFNRKRDISFFLAIAILVATLVGPGSSVLCAHAQDVVSSNDIKGDKNAVNIVTQEFISENSVSMNTENIIFENVISNNEAISANVENVQLTTIPQSIFYRGDGYQVDFQVVATWEHHYNAVIRVTNTSNETIHNWGLSFETMDEIFNLYNAKELDTENEICLFKNLGWNQDIPVGGTVEIGYTAYYGYYPDVPQEFSIASVEKVVSSQRYEISCILHEEWEGGGLVQIIIENISDAPIEDWRIEFDSAMNIVEIWNGVIVGHNGQHYQLQNTDYAQNIASGENVIVSMLIDGVMQEEPIINLVANEVVVSVEEENVSENRAEIIIDCSCMTINENSGNYILNEIINEISGEISETENVVSMNYSVIDLKGNQISNGDIAVSENWEIENIGFVLGVNYFSILAHYESGEILQKEIVIINLREENMDNTAIDLRDSDEDGISNYYEIMLDMNPDAADSDGDTLDDFVEISVTFTNPLVSDTDGDGIRDDMEDEDGDTILTNEEINYGTNPICEDTDGDGLRDDEEMSSYGTNPSEADSDRDTLYDGWEVSYGFNPLVEDTDADGIMDADERIEQTISRAMEDSSVITEVSVKLEGEGNIAPEIIIQDRGGSRELNEVVGLVGVPMEIFSLRDFESAQIVFSYEENMLGETVEENLCMMWYDRENDMYILLEDSVVDTVNNTVSYTTTHFSTYLLVDKEVWYDVWREETDYNTNINVPEEGTENYDMAICLDYTMSEEEFVQGLEIVEYILNNMKPGDRVKFGGSLTYSTFSSNQIYTSDDSVEDILTELQRLYYLYKSRGYSTESHKRIQTTLHSFYIMNSSYVTEEGQNQRLSFFIYSGNVQEYASGYSDEDINSLITEWLDLIARQSVVFHGIAVGDYERGFFETEIERIEGRIFSFASMYDMEEQLYCYLYEVLKRSESMEGIDCNDSDGDGIFDTYEINGMRASNGRIYYSDPTKIDTDGDGVNDYEEIGGAPVQVEFYILGERIYRSIFRVVSDPSNPEEMGRILDERCFFVEDIEYLPMSDNIFYMMHDVETGELDYYHNPVIGYDNLYQSNMTLLTYNEANDIINKAVIQNVIAENIYPMATQFMAQYLSDEESEYLFDGTEAFEEAIELHMRAQENAGAPCLSDDLYHVMIAGMDYLNAGETICIALEGNGRGVDYNRIGDCYFAIHSANSSAVAEISFDGQEYTMTVFSYVLDYYNWDKNISYPTVLVSPAEMYNLCIDGQSRFYMNRGRVNNELTWTNEEDLQDALIELLEQYGYEQE